MPPVFRPPRSAAARRPAPSLRHAAALAAFSALLALGGCGTPINPILQDDTRSVLAASTPAQVGATAADYRANDCDALASFKRVMQDGARVTAGFQHQVYNWHVAAIAQVQGDKSCDDALAARAGRATAEFGVPVAALTPSQAERLGLPVTHGVLVTAPASPPSLSLSPNPAADADRPGLLADDLILQVAGQPVQSPAELRGIVSLLAPGVQTPVRVLRRGVQLTVPVTLGQRATQGAADMQAAHATLATAAP